jgi:outer membrane protein OmpA-like peptidoglycan-associated protein
MTNSLLIIFGALSAQNSFNGMMSTYADSLGNGMNGVMEVPFVETDESPDLNGVLTVYEPQPEQWSGADNGLMDTFSDTVLTIHDHWSAKVFPSHRNDLLAAYKESFYFQINSAELGEQAINRLSQILPILQAEGILEVTLLGYADASGPWSFNQKLSIARAHAVKKWMKANGVSAQIKTIGMGPQGAEHGSPDALRRVDIMIEIK